MLKFTSLTLIFLLTSLFSLFAQSNESPQIENNNLHEWSIDFGISNSFTLTSFQGSTISISKLYSKDSRIRLSLSTDLSIAESSSKNERITNDSLKNSRVSDSNTNDDHYYMLSCQYVYILSPYEKTSLFLSTGPLIKFNTRTGSSPYTNYNINSVTQNKTDFEENSFGIGLLNSLGYQWFASDKISIHAEYRISLSYNWRETINRSERIEFDLNGVKTQSIRDKSNSDYSEWLLTDQGVLFGLSLFF